MKPLHQLSTVLLITGTLALSACQKASDKAVEAGVEKAFEARMEAEGHRDAKVDLSGGGFKVESKDAEGRVTSLQMASATVTDQERLLPLYPGATHEAGSDTLTKMPEGTHAFVGMTSKDDPAKIIAFYREQMTKKWPTGMTISEMSTGDGGVLTATLADGSASVAVTVGPDESGQGRGISIMAQTANLQGNKP